MQIGLLYHVSWVYWSASGQHKAYTANYKGNCDTISQPLARRMMQPTIIDPINLQFARHQKKPINTIFPTQNNKGAPQTMNNLHRLNLTRVIVTYKLESRCKSMLKSNLNLSNSISGLEGWRWSPDRDINRSLNRSWALFDRLYLELYFWTCGRN